MCSVVCNEQVDDVKEPAFISNQLEVTQLSVKMGGVWAAKPAQTPPILLPSA